MDVMHKQQLDALWNPALQSGMLCRAFVSRDPVTGVIEFSLYTEDGYGNGNIIFLTSMDALETALKAYDPQLHQPIGA